MAALNFDQKKETPWYKPLTKYTSPLNWLPEVRKELRHLPKRVHFIDTTLREGEETRGVFFSTEDKIEIAKKLSAMGVEWFDVGYPSVNTAQREDLHALMNAGLKVGWFCLVRVGVDEWKKDIDASIDAGCNKIKITGVGGGPIWGGEDKRSGRALNAFTPEGEKRILDAVDYCEKEYPDASIIVGPLDVTRGLLRPDPLVKLYKKCIAHGADMVSAIDTFGVSAPTFMRYLVSEIKKGVDDVPINIHAHNDFGLAVANSIGAVEGGATWIQSTVNGLGDRGGNASFEECVSILELLYGIDTGIKMSELYPISKFVEKVSGLKCQPHKAIVGENAWFEESHAWFLIPMRDRGLNMLMAESYKPELVGQKHNVVIGKTALRREFLEYVLQKLNLNVTPQNIEAVTDAAVKEVERRAERGQPRYIPEDEFYALCRATVK